METKETIGLIAAMTQESNALLRRIKGWNKIKLDPLHGVHFRSMDRNIILVTSGMGLKRAMETTRILIAAIDPDLLISFGIAGAVNTDLQIGDVVVAGNTCLLEKGLPGKYHPLAALDKATWNIVSQVLQPEGARLVQGTAITTRGSRVTPQQLRKTTNPVLEMETAGIAQVATEMGVPLLSIRSISDGPQAPIPLDLEEIMDSDYNFRTGKLIKAVLQHPGIILCSRQIMGNTRKAADHAAMALIAVLSQSLSVTSQ
jgi:adenosylhomocysteine nucleosidase